MLYLCLYHSWPIITLAKSSQECVLFSTMMRDYFLFGIVGWLAPGDYSPLQVILLHGLFRNALGQFRSVGAYFMVVINFNVTRRLFVAAPVCCPSNGRIYTCVLACRSGYLASLVRLCRAYQCIALLTKRWMVVGVHGSPERYLGQSSHSCTHQWRIASYHADGTTESYLQQFRRQGHRPAQPAITTSSFSSHIFNLALPPNTGNVKVCQVCMECHILPDSYQ